MLLCANPEGAAVFLGIECSTYALHLSTPLEDLFASYPWEKWGEAGLEECMVYLRCSTLVTVPKAFKGLIPKSLADCWSLYKRGSTETLARGLALASGPLVEMLQPKQEPMDEEEAALQEEMKDIFEQLTSGVIEIPDGDDGDREASGGGSEAMEETLLESEPPLGWGRLSSEDGQGNFTTCNSSSRAESFTSSSSSHAQSVKTAKGKSFAVVPEPSPAAVLPPSPPKLPTATAVPEPAAAVPKPSPPTLPKATAAVPPEPKAAAVPPPSPPTLAKATAVPKPSPPTLAKATAVPPEPSPAAVPSPSPPTLAEATAVPEPSPAAVLPPSPPTPATTTAVPEPSAPTLQAAAVPEPSSAAVPPPSPPKLAKATAVPPEPSPAAVPSPSPPTLATTTAVPEPAAAVPEPSPPTLPKATAAVPEPKAAAVLPPSPPEATAVGNQTAAPQAQIPAHAAAPPAISGAAIDRRLRRLMAPTAKGQFKIADHIREMYLDPNKKQQVVRMFENCGFNPEAFSKKYRFTTKKEKECEVEVGFEYLSKEDMADSHQMSEQSARSSVEEEQEFVDDEQTHVEMDLGTDFVLDQSASALPSAGEISSASKQLADPEVRERVQREAEKTLKKLGWPENEHAMEAASSLPKSILCITRRLARLTDIQSQLEKYMPPPPPENAPPEVKEKYNKGIRQKMVAKLQTCYNDLDAVTEDLSELKATGLVEGFEMPSGSNHGMQDDISTQMETARKKCRGWILLQDYASTAEPKAKAKTKPSKAPAKLMGQIARAFKDEQ
ncbi:KIAA0754, partial [Symbiodinium sp. KB8]